MAVFLLFFLIDSLSKYLVFTGGYPYQINKGISLGAFQSYPLFVFVIGIVFLVILFSVIIKKSFQDSDQIILISIFAAGLSNLLDRLIFGGVLDFISINGIYNVNFADITISIGVTLIIIRQIINETKGIFGKKR